MLAYFLINCESAKFWDIANAILKIEGVKMAHAVTGQFDVVVYAEFDDMDMLRILIEKIQSIEGVSRTQTAVTIPLKDSQLT